MLLIMPVVNTDAFQVDVGCPFSFPSLIITIFSFCAFIRVFVFKGILPSIVSWPGSL